MSIDALLKLRHDVTDMLGKQAVAMQEQLARLTGTDSSSVRMRGPKPKVSKLKGRKAAVKYRDKEGNKWSGRGAQPRWMTAAIKAGATRDDFLVGRAAKKSAKKTKPAKKVKVAKKRAKKAKAAKPAKKRIVRSKPKTKKRIVRSKPKISAAPAPAISPQA